MNLIRPSVGNHDYQADRAAASYRYFGGRIGAAGKGYYSYDVGAWHMVALNSECQNVGGCNASDPMGTWLASDLASNQSSCTLAYWHRPYWTKTGTANQYKGLVQVLYDGGVELLLVGHNHVYTRFAPQTPNGVLDRANGLRQITVGTGGVGHGGLASPPLPNTEKADSSTFGILSLTLRAASYDFAFVPDRTSGSFTDAGTEQCHGGSTPPPPPPTQDAPAATTDAASSVGQTSATLNGKVDPNGADTTYHFEYGTTSSYGVTTPDASAGSGNAATPVTAGVSGLQPNTDYHYRLVAENSLGTTEGADRTFTTSSSTPPGDCSPGTIDAVDVADTFVNAMRADRNFGGANILKSRSEGNASRERTAYLTFDTPALPSGCQVSGVTLELVSQQVTSGQQSLDVYQENASLWTENDLTWNTRPPHGASIATGLVFTLDQSGQHQSFDLFAGSAGDDWLTLGGLTSLSLSSPTAPAKDFESKEGGTAPVLRVSYG